ncbi:hypothetical protein TrST_g7332 [Triparma strigata]|uniref:J domain-containing protein n=1 Tax=Triparma strigata TaxID=1606541 RepID=A0A9W7ETP6_9STRA|nr:hypothetical protein TrST_g7332 [Triparma strigata]
MYSGTISKFLFEIFLCPSCTLRPNRVSSTDYYRVLGLEPGASESQIRSAYKKQSLKHHPDRAKTPAAKEAATPRFQKIAEAYEVLSDAQKKREYDAVLNGGGGFNMGGGGRDFGDAGIRPSSGMNPNRGGLFEAFHDKMHSQTRVDPFELFNSFFGRDFGESFGQRQRQQQQQHHQQQQQQGRMRDPFDDPFFSGGGLGGFGGFGGGMFGGGGGMFGRMDEMMRQAQQGGAGGNFYSSTTTSSSWSSGEGGRTVTTSSYSNGGPAKSIRTTTLIDKDGNKSTKKDSNPYALEEGGGGFGGGGQLGRYGGGR